MTLLRRAASWLVSRPAVYRVVQSLAGQARVAERLRRSLPGAARGGRVLDVGSAEGGFSDRLGVEPVFVDVDPTPLRALRRRRPAARAAAADASALPFEVGAFDVSLCVAVSHHLDDATLERTIAELARVTRGELVFLDAVRNDDRPLSRWLWRFDRGRDPRTVGELDAALRRRFRVVSREEFTIHHQYALWVAAPL
jgi:SAM-dependent methyltransferase